MGKDRQVRKSIHAAVIKGIVGYALAFTFSVILIYVLYSALPDDDRRPSGYADVGLKLPRTVEEARETAQVLSAYKDKHFTRVVLFVSAVYWWKQAFSIPGSAVMNVLVGAVFGQVLGFPLVCLLTAIGATTCFMMSKFFAAAIVQNYFPEQLGQLKRKVTARGSSLFTELLFLRLVPFTPNWLLNMCLPLLEVPVHLFFFSILIGLMPYNFTCVQAGLMLTELTSLDDFLTLGTMLRLLALALAALVPTMVKTLRSRSRTEDIEYAASPIRKSPRIKKGVRST